MYDVTNFILENAYLIVRYEHQDFGYTAKRVEKQMKMYQIKLNKALFLWKKAVDLAEYPLDIRSIYLIQI